MKKNNKEKKKENKVVKKIVSLGLGLVMVCFIAAMFFPLAKLYYDNVPPMGGDFYQTSTYFSYFHRYAEWPHLAWKYIWYNGLPTLFDYPWLHMYLGAPLLKFFTSVEANKIYSLATLFLYFIFSFLLFNKLSKNKIFSGFLASLLIWSRSTYVGLYFAGSGAFSANLMLAPLAFYFLYKYFDSQKKKWLLLCAALSGVSVAGHQGMSILFIVIPCFLLLIFYWGNEKKFFNAQKFKDILIYGLVFFFTGILGLYLYMVSFFGSLFGFDTNISMQTSTWPRKEAIRDLFAFNNPALYIALGLLIIFVIIQRNFKKSLKKSFAFVSLAFYLFIFEVLMYFGKNSFSETLGADRAYWFFALALGGIIALIFSEVLSKRPEGKKISPGFVFKSIIIVALAVGFISAPKLYWFIKQYSGLARIQIPAENLMADPNEENKSKVVPSWLETEEKNYRLHTSAGITTWWNALYDLPVTTGYADPQGVKARSWAYWRDTSITSEAVEKFEVPEEIVQKNAFFLIDWYGIKYIEYSSQGFEAADYLFGNEDLIKREESMPETGYYYYEINENKTSPIIQPTNAPTILVISSLEAYNSMLRVLAQENINSKYLIPIHYSYYLDDIVDVDLSKFDGVFLYDYKYKNEKNFSKYPEKPWRALADYVNSGGNLFLETGSEVKESDIKNLPNSGLPEVFPVNKTTRGELGSEWDISQAEDEILEQIQFDLFDPLIYENSAWKLSYSSEKEVKSWADTLITQSNYPILVKGNLGQGKVVWSGINLPYHTKSYNNLEEGVLFNNIVDYLVGISLNDIPNFEFSREKSERITLTSEGFKGILFKENNYGGWIAESDGEKVESFEAGPGMMYFPLGSEERVIANISYKGLLFYWVMFIITLITLLFCLVFFIFEEKIISLFKKILKVEKIKRLTKSWWDKDEDGE